MSGYYNASQRKVWEGKHRTETRIFYMRTSRYPDSQKKAILKMAESGIPIRKLCSEYGFCVATFYKWRAKFGTSKKAARIRELEEENRRLKEMFARDRMNPERRTGTE